MEQKVKTYINARTAFNWAALAAEIKWSGSSFHQWMNGVRPIPAEKLTNLAAELSRYGFKKIV